MFIKDREIENINGTTVTFKDGAVAEYTEKQLEYIVSDTALDDSKYQNIVIEHVATDILAKLQEHNIRKGELQSVIETVVSSFNQNFLIAVGKAFGTYEVGKYPVQMQEDIRMADIIKMKDK